jgi:U3 small nucleolar RNA-associated protein 14
VLDIIDDEESSSGDEGVKDEENKEGGQVLVKGWARWTGPGRLVTRRHFRPNA